MAEAAPVTILHPSPADPVTVEASVDAFLVGAGPGWAANTRRAYANVLARIAQHLGPARTLDQVSADEIAEALDELWATSSPATWNRNRAAVGSWLTWTAARGWPGPTLPAWCTRRTVPVDHTRAIDRAELDQLLSRRDIPLREKLLWRMLYETASRAVAVLQLDVEDLDFANRAARTRVKGGDVRWLTWAVGTARLLPRYLAGRSRGPLFVTDRAPGPHQLAVTAARDICPDTGRTRLSYERARAIAKDLAGIQLHQLRHSAATHLGEAGIDVTIIREKTGHASLRSVERYVRPGPAAVAAATEHLAPSRRDA